MRLDPAVQALSSAIGGKISVYRDFVPQRTVVVESPRDISRKIGVYPILQDSDRGWQRDNVEFAFVAHAWIDKAGKRYSWNKTISRLQVIPEVPAENLALLEKCWLAATNVKEADLRAAHFD